jgi:hypothetical protein
MSMNDSDSTPTDITLLEKSNTSRIFVEKARVFITLISLLTIVKLCTEPNTNPIPLIESMTEFLITMFLMFIFDSFDGHPAISEI